MKSIKNIIMISAAALLLCGAFVSCTKDSGKDEEWITGPNVIKVDGAETVITSVYTEVEMGSTDGINFYLFDQYNEQIGDVEIATKHQGETVDLSKLDPLHNKSTEKIQYYCYFVYLSSPASVFLWGGDDDPSFAESGTMKYTLNGDILRLNVTAVVDGKSLTINYKGKTTVSECAEE